MRREHDGPVVRHLVELIDEHRAELSQPVDDEAVVDDFVADIDRRAEPLERQLDDLDRAVDARAKAARRRDQHSKGGSVHHADRACKPSLAGIEGPTYERAHSFPTSVRIART